MIVLMVETMTMMMLMMNTILVMKMRMMMVVVVRAGVTVKDCRPIGIIGRQLRDNHLKHDDDDNGDNCPNRDDYY